MRTSGRLGQNSLAISGLFFGLIVGKNQKKSQTVTPHICFWKTGDSLRENLPKRPAPYILSRERGSVDLYLIKQGFLESNLSSAHQK